MKKIFILMLLVLGLSSCVSMKKYREVKAQLIVSEYEKAEEVKTKNNQ